MTPRYELIPAILAAGLVVGAVVGLLGSLQLSLAQRFRVGPERATTPSWMLNVGMMPGAFLAGCLLDRWGVEWIMIGGSLIVASSTIGLTLCRSFPACLASVGAIGIGLGGVLVSALVLMPIAFFPEHPAASLNLGMVFPLISLLVVPPATEALKGKLGFRRSLGVLALGALLPAVIAACTPAASFPSASISSSAGIDLAAIELGVMDLLQIPVFWMAGIACLLYGPLESLVTGWSTPYLKSMGHPDRQTAWLVSGFWMTLLGGRLATAYLQESGSIKPSVDPWLLIGLVLASGIVMGNLAGAAARKGLFGGFLLVGLCLGPILPTLLGLVLLRFPEQPGIAMGTMIGLAAVGNVVFLPLAGAYASRTSVQRVLQVPAMLAILLAAVVLLVDLAL